MVPNVQSAGELDEGVDQLRNELLLSELAELGAYTVIARDFLRQSLERGDPFLWWPHLDGGVYLHGLGGLGITDKKVPRRLNPV